MQKVENYAFFFFKYYKMSRFRHFCENILAKKSCCVEIYIHLGLCPNPPESLTPMYPQAEEGNVYREGDRGGGVLILLNSQVSDVRGKPMTLAITQVKVQLRYMRIWRFFPSLSVYLPNVPCLQELTLQYPATLGIQNVFGCLSELQCNGMLSDKFNIVIYQNLSGGK